MGQAVEVDQVSPQGKIVTVQERDLRQVLAWLRDLRARVLKKRIDPWAFRQGLLLVLHIDTRAALERGVPAEDLRTFDRLVQENAEEIQFGKGGSGR